MRRLVDTLFRPLRVKLPLEAAAVLLVGISALYVYEQTSEVRPLARPAVPAPASPSAPPPVTGTAGGAPPAQRGAAHDTVAPAEQQLARQGAPPAATEPPPSSAAGPTRNALEPQGTRGYGEQPAPMAGLGSEATPARKPEVKADMKKEAQAEARPHAGGAPMTLAQRQKVAQSAEPAPSRDAATTHTGPAPAPSETAPPAAAAPAAETHGRAGEPSATAPAAPAQESAEAAAKKSRAAAARLMRAADASGRLIVTATEPAEIALDALLSRLGATRVARRIERAPGPILVDVNVPAVRYHELLEGLGHIGRWTTEHESKTLPLEVRVEVAITVEP